MNDIEVVRGLIQRSVTESTDEWLKGLKAGMESNNEEQVGRVLAIAFQHAAQQCTANGRYFTELAELCLKPWPEIRVPSIVPADFAVGVAIPQRPMPRYISAIMDQFKPGSHGGLSIGERAVRAYQAIVTIALES